MYRFDDFRSFLVKSERRLFILLGSFACLLLTIYLFYFFYIPQTSGRMTRPSAALIKDLPFWRFISSLPFPITQDGEMVAWLLVGSTALAFVIYGLAIFICWNQPTDKNSLTVIICSTVLFFLISTFAFPNLNTDIYHYITQARVAAVHNSNPHYVPPDAFPQDPIYPYASQRYTWIVGDKLALWTLISIPIARLAGDDPVTNLLAFRTVFFLFNLMNVTLITLILRKNHPRYVLAGILLYAWNPIIVVLGQSKVDSVMMFFLLLAFLFLVHERKGFAVVSMTLSVFVKLITLPLVVFYFLREIKLKKWRDVILGVSLFVITAVVVTLPFWEGASMLKSHTEVAIGEAGASLPWMVRFLIVPSFALFFLWVGYLQDGSDERLLLGWSLIALSVSLFLVRIHNSWYHITFIAIASIFLNWRIVLVAIGLTFSAFLFNMWYSTFTDEFRVPELSNLPTLMVYLAPACVMIIFVTVIYVLKRLRLNSKARLLDKSTLESRTVDT